MKEKWTMDEVNRAYKTSAPINYLANMLCKAVLTDTITESDIDVSVAAAKQLIREQIARGEK